MCNKTNVVSEGHGDSVERPNVEHLDGFDREAHSTPAPAAFQNLRKKCKKLKKQMHWMLFDKEAQVTFRWFHSSKTQVQADDLVISSIQKHKKTQL